MFESLKQSVDVARRVDSGEVDGFNRPIYTEETETVAGVLITPEFESTKDVSDERPDGDRLTMRFVFPKSYDGGETLRGAWIDFNGVRYAVRGEPHCIPACPTEYNLVVWGEALHG